MSNDLISRSEVLKVLEYVFNKYNMTWNKYGGGGFAKEVPEAIEAIPTAYDVDKVVERLESHKACYEAKAAEYDQRGDIENMDVSDAVALAYGKAIKIAKERDENEKI